MTETTWDYFGRSGARGIYELYRAPHGETDPSKRFAEMERLHSDGSWVYAGGDTGLKNDWASGWFDFDDDALSPDEADRLAKRWLAGRWPGRA